MSGETTSSQLEGFTILAGMSPQGAGIGLFDYDSYHFAPAERQPAEFLKSAIIWICSVRKEF